MDANYHDEERYLKLYYMRSWAGYEMEARDMEKIF